MTAPVRLAKRVTELTGCSRREAEIYVEGGWVRVDGEVVDEPQAPVAPEQRVELAEGASLVAPEPVTLLLHKPPGLDAASGPQPASALLTRASQSALDFTGSRVLRRHFTRLTAVLPLESAASGLQVYSQDPRLLRRIKDDGKRIEQEFIVEVAGDIAPYGLSRLAHGQSFAGRPLPPCKVSWQNETRLRFALCAVQPGQLAAICAEVGLQVVAMKRIRIGSVPLGKMAVGEWRYLPPRQRL